jgi:alkanesulfonate monooxygenase SsuD/methylene tetrahydromethanopterin reductase-like flavin-dependent oxidoreductase (luciferase family)
MVGVNVVCASSDEEAARLFTSIQQRFLGMVRGRRGPLPAPIDPAALEALWSAHEKAQVQRMLAASAVGSAPSVCAQLDALVARTAADELIVAGAIFDHAARVASYERLAQCWLAPQAAPCTLT